MKYSENMTNEKMEPDVRKTMMQTINNMQVRAYVCIYLVSGLCKVYLACLFLGCTLQLYDIHSIFSYVHSQYLTLADNIIVSFAL